MHIHFGTELLAAEWPQSVVCIGTFDGVHLGHQAVIRAARDKADEVGAPLVLVTFDRHPAATLRPESAPPDLCALDQNLRELAQNGVDLAVILTFDAALAQTEAEDFFQGILLGRLHASAIVVGHDFAFGRGRRGNAAWLSERITTLQVDPFELDGVRVSSTRIRQAVSEGDCTTANTLLGRNWAMEGIVAHGEKVGRTLGYPTANLARSRSQIVPAHGIYAGICHTPLGAYGAAISVGVRPTFGENSRTVEAFLIDFPATSLYGRAIELAFLSKIRDELRFESVEELVVQMGRDVDAIRDILRTNTGTSGLF